MAESTPLVLTDEPLFPGSMVDGMPAVAETSLIYADVKRIRDLNATVLAH